MKTPAGKECSFFYGNYHRGRNNEECRLMPDGERGWNSKLCTGCPMPGYQQANSCASMRYRATIEQSWKTLFVKKVKISTWCEKSKSAVTDPHIGCGQCHPTIQFVVKE